MQGSEASRVSWMVEGLCLQRCSYLAVVLKLTGFSTKRHKPRLDAGAKTSGCRNKLRQHLPVQCVLLFNTRKDVLPLALTSLYGLMENTESKPRSTPTHQSVGHDFSISWTHQNFLIMLHVDRDFSSVPRWTQLWYRISSVT